MAVELLIGNGAIARGLIEQGCEVATAYPGTPSTEVLEEVARFKKQLGVNTYVEWSVNEKIAFDVAFAASMTGKRSATAMKQVGLNVASDSLTRSAYTGVIGGMIIIPCDDPGPHSSQTEQDSRILAMFAKIPALDPATTREAHKIVKYAYELSERWEIPVILRPSIRICHSRQPVELNEPSNKKRIAKFKKDPHRWAATPQYTLKLHKILNEKIQKIHEEFENESALNYILNNDSQSTLGIIASGSAFSCLYDILTEKALKIPLMKITTVFPLPVKKVQNFINKFERVLVLEEPGPAIELQIIDRTRVMGRLDNVVPSEGELLPDVIYDILSKVLDKKILTKEKTPELAYKAVPPSLCPGCAHRAAFFAIRKALPNAIFTSDIGCYTLGLNMKAVDTVINMGASITIATGLSHAFRADGLDHPIIATIGDSTFFHAGIPPLLNAHITQARFILVILDNGCVAMTGFQPTPATGVQADGRSTPQASIRKLVEACGIKLIEEIDPYKVDEFIQILKKARAYTRDENGGVVAIIAKHPCVLLEPVQKKIKIKIIEKCNGCGYCLSFCECPALSMNPETEKVEVDYKICVDCGICIECCPPEAIVEDKL